jgi:purine-binding chemotaxis protein CheW
MLPVGDDRYALAAEDVREVAAAPRTTDLPGMPAWALGLVNLRGEVVPLLDTAVLLGLEPSPPPAAFAVVVHTSFGLAALASTAMPEMVTLGDDVGASELAGTSGRRRLDGSYAVVLDVDALLTAAHGDPSRTGEAP